MLSKATKLCNIKIVKGMEWQLNFVLCNLVPYLILVFSTITSTVSLFNFETRCTICTCNHK